MVHRLLVLPLFFAIAASPLLGADPSPYAGQQKRHIKALSETEMEGLLAGKGMGFAKAAELNGHPGPLHVLELAGPLGISDAQRKQVTRVFAAMKARASQLGQAIVTKEQKLDRLFAESRITRTSLATLTGEIGQLTGELRGVHLAAHLDMVALLTPHQTRQYDRLRGYTDAGSVPQHGGHEPPAGHTH